MRRTDVIGRGALVLASLGLSLACTAHQPVASNPTPSPTASSVTVPPVAQNASSPSASNPGPVQPALNATPAPTQNPEDKMPRVSAEEAKRLVAAKQAVLIDVRGTQAYQEAHIKGALDFPGQRIEGSDFKDLPRDKRIIAYCT